jgi:alkylated DNA repair dioxygenase AlkB
MAEPEKIGALLQAATGFDDVSYILEALRALPSSELSSYLENFLGKDQREVALEIAGLMGASPAPSAGADDSAPQADDASARGGWHRKKDLDDAEPFAPGRSGKKKSQNQGSASAPGTASRAVVGGASVVASKPKSGKKAQQSLSSLDALASALRPGRHVCMCNARRHALLYNCLACGKVICEQEGTGPCLFCGCDPDTPLESSRELAAGSGDAARRAAAFKDRLLDFDRTSAKRTAVIDDQVDYYASAGADAWLTQGEKAAAEQAQVAREEAKERQRREVRLTFDFENREVRRDGGGDARGSSTTLSCADDGRDGDGPCYVGCDGSGANGDRAGPAPAGVNNGGNGSSGGGKGGGGGGKGSGSKGGGKGGGRQGVRESADLTLRVCSADYVDGSEEEAATVRGLVGTLINPSLAARPMFTSSKKEPAEARSRPKRGGGGRGDAAGEGGASEFAGSLHEQAMTQGLQYSARRVQHDDDNPWLHQLLRQASGGGEWLGETDSVDALVKMAKDGQEARRRAENDAGRLLAPAGEGSTSAATVATGGTGTGAGAGAGAQPRGMAVEDAVDAVEDDVLDDSGRAMCISMHQPWASLLACGIKRVEGRGWPTDHRGRLWIASTAREPSDLEVAQVEQEYMEHYSAVHTAGSGAQRYDDVMEMQQRVHTFPAFPTSYPTSALLGCVSIADCIHRDDYLHRFPSGEDNSSTYLFLTTRPRTIAVPMRVSGQHKIWQLPPEIAQAARKALRPASAVWDAKPPSASARPPEMSATSSLRREASEFVPKGAARSGGGDADRFDLYGTDAAAHRLAGAPPRCPASLGLVADRRRRLTVLQDGMVLLRGALELSAQQAIVDLVRELGMGAAGFYAPKTRGGSMHLMMMCLGLHWNPVNQKYEERRSNLDDIPAPPLPPMLWEIVRDAAATATEACASLPSIEPGVCLVNHYGHSGRLGFHQDKSEREKTLRRGSPVVSISIGDSCEFGYCDSRPEEADLSQRALGGGAKPRTVRLDSGDVLIFGGPSRLVYHGVTKIYPNHRPKGLELAPGRLNLTFREV